MSTQEKTRPVFQMRIDEDLLTQAHEKAKSEGKNLTEVVRQYLKRYVKK